MRDMSALEETYWFALYQNEPWETNLRRDISLAQIAQLQFNANVKGDKRRKLTDFMPFFRKRATVDEDVSDKLKERFSLLMDKK